MGLLLDFQIRDATQNQHTLDDLMRLLYRKYYKELQRGFAEAEFHLACESVAGIRLDELFGYINTTGEIDDQTYLGMAGLQLETQAGYRSETRGRITCYLTRKQPADLQLKILQTWQNDER